MNSNIMMVPLGMIPRIHCFYNKITKVSTDSIIRVRLKRKLEPAIKER